MLNVESGWCLAVVCPCETGSGAIKKNSGIHSGTKGVKRRAFGRLTQRRKGILEKKKERKREK